MLSALLASVGAIVYGSADFLGGLAARRMRAIVVTATAATAGLLALAVAVVPVGGIWQPSDILWGALSGVAGVIAIGLLYACLAIGPMSILSPLTAVVAAVAPIAWGLLGGDALGPLGYAGLTVAVVAVVLVGFVPGEGRVRPRARGLLYAVGSGLGIGAMIVLLDQAGDDSGVLPLLANRIANATITWTVVAVLALIAVGAGRAASSALATGPERPDRRAWMLAIGCGLADTTANVLLLEALRSGELAVVGALTALYPAGTILLAAVVLRERIAAVQWIGLALALTAGVLLAVN